MILRLCCKKAFEPGYGSFDDTLTPQRILGSVTKYLSWYGGLRQSDEEEDLNTVVHPLTSCQGLTPMKVALISSSGPNTNLSVNTTQAYALKAEDR